MSTDFANAGPRPATVVPLESPAEVKIPPSAYTWDGFRAWAVSEDYPNHGKITFAAGKLIIDMSPESFEEQGAVKTEIARVLSQFVRERGLGYYRIDRTLVSNKEASLSSEPDSLFVSRTALRSGRAKLVPEVGRPTSSKEILGTVDWVLEIVSPSSRRKDASTLRDAYFRAGIPEYWLIDVLDQQINFEILVPGKDAYQPVISEDGWLASPTFKASFRLVREKDEDDYWQYTLELK
ncbi:MAG: Uma2 family endonuclease [Pirellulales bacterium]|nr:Uma2 family endonuclease [Pirellulales bacterium]